MFTKSTPHEKVFAPGTSRPRDTGVTFRLDVAKDEVELLQMGQRIKELREAHGFKQQWIADKVGVELRTYQFWQAGKNQPEQEHLEALAKLFKVTPKFILRGETPEPLTSRTDQLARIEHKLDLLLNHLGISLEEPEQTVDAVLDELEQTAARSQPSTAVQSSNRRAARRRKPA